MSTTYFRLLALLFTAFSPQILHAQSFIGSTVDNYAGIHSVIVNPASAVDSRMKVDINLLSTSAFVTNDFISIDISDIEGFNNGFEFDSDANTNSRDNNNFLGNLDILGPSVLFNLNEKSSMAITTRVRGYFNLNNIGGELYEVTTGDEAANSFNLSMNNLSGVVHAWAEFGVTYGRVILEKDRHLLKAAATLKYLAGAGGIYGFSPLLGANYTSNNELLTTTGYLNYGTTSGFDSDEITFSDISSGVGADIGVVYELKNRVNWDPRSYKLRVGFSVTDIGAISYKNSSNFRYDMDTTIDGDQFDEYDLDEVLENNYDRIEILGKSRFGLPTAIHIFADYSITNKFYVSAQGAISIKKMDDTPVSTIINLLSVTPRFEMKWISIYSPLSFRQYDSSLAWGFGLRAGPLLIGSGSILTNLISSSSRSADVYVGLKFPLYK